MRKFFLLAALAVAAYLPAKAQISVNIDLQPLWGPVGYDHVDYYYIPDIDAYYNVATQEYVYMDGGVWVTRRELPPRYRTFDLYDAHKVVINEPQPWMHDRDYHARYARYIGHHDQHAIRDSRDNRYFANPQHPMHGQWHAEGHPGHDDHWHEDHGHEGHGHEDHGR